MSHCHFIYLSKWKASVIETLLDLVKWRAGKKWEKYVGMLYTTSILSCQKNLLFPCRFLAKQARSGSQQPVIVSGHHLWPGLQFPHATSAVPKLSAASSTGCCPFQCPVVVGSGEFTGIRTRGSSRKGSRGEEQGGDKQHDAEKRRGPIDVLLMAYLAMGGISLSWATSGQQTIGWHLWIGPWIKEF